MRLRWGWARRGGWCILPFEEKALFRLSALPRRNAARSASVTFVQTALICRDIKAPVRECGGWVARRKRLPVRSEALETDDCIVLPILSVKCGWYNMDHSLNTNDLGIGIWQIAYPQWVTLKEDVAQQKNIVWSQVWPNLAVVCGWKGCQALLLLSIIMTLANWWGEISCMWNMEWALSSEYVTRQLEKLVGCFHMSQARYPWGDW